MDLPVLDMTEKYRAVKSSANGIIYIQNGAVFEESGKYAGPAPAWGPDLFKDSNGSVLDPYSTILSHAEEHRAEHEKELEKTSPKYLEPTKMNTPKEKPVKEPKIVTKDTIDDVFDTQPKKSAKKDFKKKVKHAFGYGSGTV